MADTTEELSDLFVDVTGKEATVTERDEGPSRDPIDEEEQAVVEDVASVAEDGLDDAVAGAEADQAEPATN